MDIEHLCWLREVLAMDPGGNDMLRLEFSYDNGKERAPRFFRVPQEDVLQAHALYKEWGGIRETGYRVGSTVKGPSHPFLPSIKVWRKNG